MNIIDKTVNDLRDRLDAYVKSEKGQILKKINDIVNETGLSINTIFIFRRGEKTKPNGSFETRVLSKICDYLDKKGV